MSTPQTGSDGSPDDTAGVASPPEVTLDVGSFFPQAAQDPDLDRWTTLARKALRGRPLERLTRQVAPGVSLPPLVAEPDRDARPLGRVGPWQIRQEIRGPGLKAASRAARSELDGGVEAIWLRVDRATRLGVRPDEAREHDVDPGLTLLTRDDLAGVLRKVDLGTSTIVLEAGANVLALLGAVLAIARDRDVGLDQLRLVLHGDPLGTLARDGRLPRGVDAAYDDLAACVRFAREHAPGLRVVALSGLPAHEAGADAATEIGVVLASLAETARRLGARGLALSDWLPHAEITVGVGRDLLTELAKLRALRRVLSRLLAASGASDLHVPLHARMADAQLAHRDPWTNLLRATQAGFAAAVGGADAITLLPFDRGLGESTAQARRIARNQQLLLREESRLDRVTDPAAGSGTLEHLTDGLARAGWQALQQLEREGGLLSALGAGTLAGRLAERTAALRERVRKRKDVLVGISRYPDAEGERVTRPVRDPATVDRQLRSRWEAASLAGGSHAVDDELDRALTALRSGDVLRVGPATHAAGRGLLLAEIAGAVPGMAFTATPLPPYRPAADWERVSDAVQALDPVPGVFLANLGPLAVHTARAGFARDLLQAGGFEVVDVGGFTDPESAAIRFGTSGCPVVCICGTDNDYEQVVPRLARQLTAGGARAVLVAGRWPDDPGPWKEAGVTDVVHMGADVLSVLVRVARAVDAPLDRADVEVSA